MMVRFVWMANAALAAMGACNPCFSQSSITPIASFNDVAGKWTGHADTHSVTLRIESSGRFSARYILGGETGEARLEGGTLMIPLPKHEGHLQLARDGDMLKGPGVISGRTWMVSLTRSGPGDGTGE